VTMNVYIDNGTVFGQLDVNDTYLVSKTETVVTDGGFSTVYLPYDENILIQTTTSAGCIDNIVFIPNVGVLPVRLISFAGSRSENSNLLKWIVAENESGKQIQIERSNDGTNFTTIKTIINTDKTGTENYTYSDGTAASAYYRIKLISTTGKETVSQVIYLGSQPTTNTALRLSINPVDSYLSFSYSSNSNAPAIINIYNLSGVKVYSQKVNINKGANTITIPADGRLYRGTYILELANDTDNNRVKFIKR
ncbi:MAG TPA: T9SS type A sorting domain-containing protein, partial [Flavisolibacter sp.]|nr:T9SS type A sorting domain-containing protein [Flavisolibacter sp.]